MSRSWNARRVWTGYGCCVAVATAALALLTLRAGIADRAEAGARRAAAVEENARLALWRLDSRASALVALESVRAADPAAAPPRPREFAPAPPAGGTVRPDRNADEFRARQRVMVDNVAQQAWNRQEPSTPATALVPSWDGEQLVLVAGTTGPSAGGGRRPLDWPAMRLEMLASIADLLPAADLVPTAGDGQEGSHLMAALPVRLVPGDLPVVGATGLSPIGWATVVAWLAMAVSAAAAAALLAGVLSLSERRAAFVSSVTHELRTPLTTLLLYSTLLEEEMVDEGDAPAFHATLRGEAERLTHLVENVLAYSRLEADGPRPRAALLDVPELVAGVTDRSAERARGAGFDWRVSIDDAAAAARVLADPAAVEQIVFNLVDNACKYGRGGLPPAVELAVSRRGGMVALTVGDDGPGVPAADGPRLFEPFRRGSSDATAPGVGLGLALARRLARHMAGDVILEDRAGGARFTLLLPSGGTAGDGRTAAVSESRRAQGPPPARRTPR